MRKVLLLLSVGTIGFVTTVHAQSYEQYKKQRQYESRYQQEQLQHRRNQANAVVTKYIAVTSKLLNTYYYPWDKASVKAGNGRVTEDMLRAKYPELTKQELDLRLAIFFYTDPYMSQSMIDKARPLRDRMLALPVYP
ncbi:TPA: hypothetical protein I9Y78_000075 [Elizabethkingia anophelis]|uniref:hypothetical protein n=1 Tax=Elizabethkingia anophelis TaxID=1117645 RepID=UPI00040346A5|nr:hypothetical protein [Elizabethkingia anophelis]MCT3746035.1 hypothetical protein [Elizabethkingia anophelis]MDC8024580.1 hypothetical protein [Elizabethkingia anophelis]MDV3492395.1 hypothetical protein [Elizabethkingia anophelis]MDV4112609.1 hypothetical protein [Elizabethkingia anophelis]HAT3990803.1 hypothetical protein [Elizabethkingia anophelis]